MNFEQSGQLWPASKKNSDNKALGTADDFSAQRPSRSPETNVGAHRHNVSMLNRPVTKKILILANSRKHSGRCIAGIELINDKVVGWVRPVSSRQHLEVSEEERRYRDGRDPQLLDVVSVPLRGPAPDQYQTENWVLDDRRYWEHVNTVTVASLPPFTDGRDLWLRELSSTRSGLNDRLPLELASSETDSIRLVHVDDLRYRVFEPSAGFPNSKRKVQAHFTHLGEEYRIFVTDPQVERLYLSLADEHHQVGAAYLTISLGEPYDGFSYKLVAAVIPG